MSELRLRHKEINIDSFSIEKTHQKGMIEYTMAKMPAIKPEPLSPLLSKVSPEVLFAVEEFHFYGVDGKAKNWIEFGKWINDELLQGRNTVTEATKNEVLRLTNEVSSPIEKAKIIYKYVQDNTRYISVQVGIGGVQPIEAIEVDKLKYGDCKGLTNYTQALLSIVGVKSYYSVVESGRHIVDFHKDFASIEQGDHIILCIPANDDLLWLDCTSQKNPFGFIGSFTDNRNVLVVGPNGGEILKTSEYKNEANYQKTHSNIKLFGDAGFEANINVKSQGIQYDDRFLIQKESERNIVEFYKEIWGYVNNLELKKYHFKNDKTTVEFHETLDVAATSYATKIGNRLMFKPNFFNRNSFVPDRCRIRTLPVEIERGYLDEDEFQIEIPKDYEIESIFDKKLITNKFGEYFVDCEVDNNKITYKRKLFIKEGVYAKEDYKLYREFRRNVSKLDNSKIVLIKSK
jgi:hypothetical protein